PIFTPALSGDDPISTSSTIRCSDFIPSLTPKIQVPGTKSSPDLKDTFCSCDAFESQPVESKLRTDTSLTDTLRERPALTMTSLETAGLFSACHRCEQDHTGFSPFKDVI